VEDHLANGLYQSGMPVGGNCDAPLPRTTTLLEPDCEDEELARRKRKERKEKRKAGERKMEENDGGERAARLVPNEGDARS
jgi:hypothetical protein